MRFEAFFMHDLLACSMPSLDVLRLVVGLGFLFYAAVLDLRTRRVPNGVWLAFGTCAALLFLVDVSEHRFGWLQLAVAAGIVGLAYGLWFIHIFAGGADAKAFMVLGLLLPTRIQWDWLGQALPVWTSPLPGAIVVLANSVLVFALAPILLFLYNASKGHVRFPAMLLGYRMSLEGAREKFVWVVDQVDAQGVEHHVLFPSKIDDEAYAANLQRLQERGRTHVWVTPKIPFMLPLAFGYLTAFTVGDVLFHLVQAVVLRTR